MRREIGSLSRFLWFGLAAVAAVMVCASNARAQQGTNSQLIHLPDPTPRETDPRLLLGDNSQAGTSTQEAVEHRNQKRRELTVWAADELVALSQHLQADVTKPTFSTSKASATANAEKIEQLAKNLTVALKAQ